MSEHVNQIITMPERRLTTIVATLPVVLEQARPVMDDIAFEMLLQVKEKCLEDSCQAFISSNEVRIPDIHTTVRAVGVICSQAGLGVCPKGVRQEL